MGEWKQMPNYKLSNRAVEYFGGDVQRFEIFKIDGYFKIRQQPHWGNVKWVAISAETTQRAAIREFNQMARAAETEFC